MAEVTPKKVTARARRANAEERREVRHVVYVTAAEHGDLLFRAAAQGVTVPRLLFESTMAAAGETPTERRNAMVELFALRRQLSGIAVNINQAARRANMGDGFPIDEAQGYLREARKVARRIDEAIDGLAHQGVRV